MRLSPSTPPRPVAALFVVECARRGWCSSFATRQSVVEFAHPRVAREPATAEALGPEHDASEAPCPPAEERGRVDSLSVAGARKALRVARERT